MGMKSKSAYFSSNGTSGGVSKRGSGVLYKSSNEKQSDNGPNPSMSDVGKKLYDSAQNQSLKNQIIELYRPGAHIGDGGTAGALRHEIKTGDLVGGKSHYIKAKERCISLERLIQKGNLSESDKQIAQSLIDDLIDAMKGYKK